jgi:hypothetical protein
MSLKPNDETKKPNKYTCDKCMFNTSNKRDYNRHLNTAKHKMGSNGVKWCQEQKVFNCDCGKTYKYRQGYYRHKKLCNANTDIKNTIVKPDIQENLEDKPSMIDIITQNREIMDVLIAQNKEQAAIIKEQSDTIRELIPKIGNNNTTTNNNNNQFNLQVFLNEDCKDAINFSEFIENMKVSFEDLEHQAEVGYINGVSKLFIENLRDLGTHKRPIHCTDKKRKTLYIKENNEWDKEGSQDTLKKGIREVSRKGFECLMKEKQENQEEYKDIDSDFTQKCLSIHRNILPGVPQETTISKVIEKISQNSGINE